MMILVMNNIVKTWLAPALVLLLVAGTSYVLGLEGRQSQDGTTVSAANQSAVAQNTTSKATAASTNVISDIQQSLNQPSPAPAKQSSSASQNKTTTKSSGSTQTQAPASNGIVNINTATLAELDTLPGIGPVYAQAIINYRTQNGPFVRVDDLVKIKGIGPKTLEKLRPLITV